MRRVLQGFIDNSGLLISGSFIALIWANLHRQSYEQLAHSLHFVVNDVGMAFFFALAAKEVVEATAPNGALHSPRRSALPLLAAVGGMLGPAIIFLWLTSAMDRPDLERGWAIPTATDIAFSYLAARIVFGRKHPAIPFLLLLAIADDALGLLIIAAFYPAGPVSPGEFAALLAAAILLARWLQKRRTLSFWPYVAAAGIVSWVAFYRGGLHPALALVPIVPFMPHASRDPGLFVENTSLHDTLNEFERWWKRPVDVMLFFFGFVNAGVTLVNAGAGTWFVLASILIGKPVGIITATVVTTICGLHRPKGMTWRDVVVVSVLAGIGFTVALFFATAAFPYGRLLNETKLGALLSFAAFGLALVVARSLRVGRYATGRGSSEDR